LETDKEFKKMTQGPIHSGKRTKLPDGHGEVLCPLVWKIKTNPPGVTVESHALAVHDFGRIYVIEDVLGSWQHTLTMLRLEVSSPVKGTGVVAQGIGHGNP
jgi:hypothetical protein